MIADRTFVCAVIRVSEGRKERKGRGRVCFQCVRERGREGKGRVKI